MATGVIYFHRFYMKQSFKTFPRWVCCLIIIYIHLNYALLRITQWWLLKKLCSQVKSGSWICSVNVDFPHYVGNSLCLLISCWKSRRNPQEMSRYHNCCKKDVDRAPLPIVWWKCEGTVCVTIYKFGLYNVVRFSYLLIFLTRRKR